MKIQTTMRAVVILIFSAFVIASCKKESVSNSPATTGKGGSVTRFTIAKSYLYVVSNHFLYVYSLNDPSKPNLVHTSDLNYDIETIYPYNDTYLFLGTRTGLYVYSIDKPDAPTLIGQAQHARSCDPVVVNDSVAFVTLKSNGNCGPATPGLYIHDITDVTHPIVKDSIPLPDPGGLGLQDSILYVCCGTNGMKVFNVKKPYSPVLLSTKSDGNYLDVIPYNGILICAMDDGVLLYDIRNPSTPVMIKEIAD